MKSRGLDERLRSLGLKVQAKIDGASSSTPRADQHVSPDGSKARVEGECTSAVPRELGSSGEFEASSATPAVLDPRDVDRLRARGLLGRAPSRASASMPRPPEREPRPSCAKAELSLDAVVTTRFPVAFAHGRSRFQAVLEADPAPSAILGKTPSFSDLPWRDRVWFDAETTSLESGAGVFVFLLGVGRFEGDEFVVRQFLLGHPALESEMLAGFESEVLKARGLVSFCGKSFDVPRTRDRFAFQALRAGFAELPHLDLYHASKRLFGHAFADAKLQTFERNLCGFEREDDLPGAECPAHWFAWQRGKAHRMDLVLRHNLEDILTLPLLEARLIAALSPQEIDPRAHLVACTLAAAAEPSAIRIEALVAAAERDRGTARPHPPALALQLELLLRRGGAIDLARDLLLGAHRLAPAHAALGQRARRYANA